MEFEKGDCFKEYNDPDVSEFVIIEVSESRKAIASDGEKVCGPAYRVTEKHDRWFKYWIPEEKLERGIEEGACEHIGQVTEESFNKIT